MKKFQTFDRHHEDGYERRHRDNENGYEKSQQRHDRCNENGYEKSQQRHDRCNENGYEKSRQRHDRCNENGYERSRQRHDKYNENGYKKPQQRHDKYTGYGFEKPYQKHDRYKENGYEIPPRQRPKNEETKKISMFDSSGCRKDSEENMLMERHENSHQVERRAKISPQDYLGALSRLVKSKHGINRVDEHKLNTNQTNIAEQSDSKEYEKIRKGTHPLSTTDKRMLYPFSKNLNVKDEISSLNDAKGLERRDSYITEENSPKNPDIKNLSLGSEHSLTFHQRSDTSSHESNWNERRDSHINKKSSSDNPDVKNLQFGNDNLLPFLQKSNISYESNQNERDSYINEENSPRNPDIKNLQFTNENSLSFLQRRISYESNQSNGYIHGMSEISVYTQEVKENFQSDINIAPNSSLNAVSQNNFPYESLGFNMLKITDLIYYNANLMHGQKLFEFASAVQSKILEKIDKFEYPEKDELQFLCEISDGDQSEKNQRIITSRACRIVRNIIDKFPHFLDTQEPPHPPPQIIVYQTVPISHVVTNSYCSESAIFEIVQNSEVPAINYNTIPAYNIPSTARFAVTKEVLDSSNSQIFNSHIGNCEVQELSTINAKNSSLINNENKDVDESSKHCTSPINPEASAPTREFHFNEKKSFFTSLEFNELLNYDIDKLQGDMVFDYAFSMKNRIIKKISLNHFRSPYKEKLYFLCQLTDGTQREQNQKLINKRMCDLIISDYEDSLKECNKNFLNEQSENDHQRRSH